MHRVDVQRLHGLVHLERVLLLAEQSRPHLNPTAISSLLVGRLPRYLLGPIEGEELTQGDAAIGQVLLAAFQFRGLLERVGFSCGLVQVAEGHLPHAAPTTGQARVPALGVQHPGHWLASASASKGGRQGVVYVETGNADQGIWFFQLQPGGAVQRCPSAPFQFP